MSCAPPPIDPTPIVRDAAAPDGAQQAPTPPHEAISFRPSELRLRRYLAYAASRPEQAATTPSAEEARRLYKWGGQFSAVLTEMRSRFGGDLDQYLIYMVFMLAEHDRSPGAGGLNVFSVAEITGIPRETVRRKLAAMAARGEVQRGEDGLYHPGPAASLDGFFHDLGRLA
jgi:hypothetical protein